MGSHRGTQEVQTSGSFEGNHAFRAPQYGDPTSWGARRLVKRGHPRHFAHRRSVMPRPMSSGYARSSLSRSTGEFLRIRMFCEVFHIEGSGANEIHGSSLQWARPIFFGYPTASRTKKFGRTQRKRVSATWQCVGFPRSISHYASGGIP